MCLALLHRHRGVRARPDYVARRQRCCGWCIKADRVAVDGSSQIESLLRPLTNNSQLPTTTTMGSIFSAIGRGINAVISAIANVIMTIVSAITNVIVTIIGFLTCGACGGRRSGGARSGRRRGAATY
ncbi:hypothetical protein EXIGLDRAFT_726774 [Exidia glandulosa HHB12029]|uniref:Uncharacterized protein n=1 Tax=Exidia glandulosa HHB12029 TaxID=1314781 RepID=A0A165M7N3_EXIGL|nr:hypothetical protein EXIGLDRAFT_726774 [Exidia glandulosa HHB12029]